MGGRNREGKKNKLRKQGSLLFILFAACHPLRSPPLCAHLWPCAARPALYSAAAAGPPRAMNNERRGAAGSAGPRHIQVSVTEG